MTVGQLIECLLGKYCAIDGLEGDGTPFTHLHPDTIGDLLEQVGFHRSGKSVLIHGHTGKVIPTMIFIGPTYYQRLKHMVKDKIHARRTGPISNLTRQPVEGRARDGGLRFGEMEKDCFLSHGVSRFLRGRLFDQSDYYTCYLCPKCGFLAQLFRKNVVWCKACTSPSKLIEIPYAAKLLFQELKAMHIAPRLKLRENQKLLTL